MMDLNDWQEIIKMLKDGSTVELKIEHGQVCVIEIKRKLKIKISTEA